MHHNSIIKFALLASVAAFGAPSGALAQDDPGASAEDSGEIIVTARKRSEP